MKRVLLFLFLAMPALGQVRPYILSIEEIPQGNGNAILCPQTSADCSADILSTLQITPNLANVPRPATASASLNADAASDAQRRAHLNEALGELNQSLDLSRQIIERHGAGEQSEALEAMSDQFARLRIALNDAIVKYLAVDHPGEDIQRGEEYRAAFRSPSATGQWLAEQIRTLDQRAAARAAAGGLQLRLAAARIRANAPPAPLHLPGYDTYEPLSATPIQRITFNVSSEERARNAADVQATAAIVSLVRTNFKALADAYKKELADARARVDTALDAVRQSVARNGDLNVPVALLAKDLNDLAAGASEPLKSQLTKAAADTTTLAATVQTAISALTAAQTALAAVPSKLEGSSMNVAAGRPDLVLDNVLGIAAGAQTTVTSTVAALRGAHDDLPPQLAAVESDLRALGANAPAVGSLVVARIRGDLIEAIVAPVRELDATKLILGALGNRNAASSAKTAGPVADVSAPQVTTVSNPMPTRLEIARTDPKDNDTIDLAAQVLDGANGVVYEEHRSVRVRFYGWHSGLASGLVFVRAQETALENLKPEAAAIWRIVRTPRPWEDDWRHWYFRTRPAVGIHLTTLHFGGDNSAVQFGLGVSAHLFDDLFQLGYGWNLGATTSRGYGYFGLGIMKLLRDALAGR
ncbi:MAG TPA: hypothetical protein VEO74_16540 [Thermoanaerobaculia bacterium]|nr:hypothetical protein [Thermoanaerobaculia bacterium]